jgi:hypothetical protein
VKNSISYQQWLSYNDQDRENLAATWNAYDGEGFDFAIMALARFVNSSNLPLVQANVGIYHGGTYLLKAVLREDVDRDQVGIISPRFEGFQLMVVDHKNEWVGGFSMGK